MRKKGISYDRIYVSFERHMKCGVGKCGHWWGTVSVLVLKPKEHSGVV